MKDTAAYTEKGFWKVFPTDVSNARARVVIQSPFVTRRRLADVETLVRSLRGRNIRLCIFLQEVSPKRLTIEEQNRLRDFNSLAERLRELGAHVNVRPNIHAKLAIVDEAILWEGSLNILSHSYTTERMRRIVDVREVHEALLTHSLYDCQSCIENMAQMQIERFTTQILTQRLSLKITQKELADACGMKASNLARIESKSPDLKTSTLKRIARYVGLEIILVPRWLLPTVASLIHDTRHEP